MKRKTNHLAVHPYLYLTPPAKKDGLGVITFNKSVGGTGTPNHVRCFFNTPHRILPEQWDKITRLVLPSHPEADSINANLRLLHGIAMEACASGYKQDEVRKLIDVAVTKAYPPNTTRNTPCRKVADDFSLFSPSDMTPTEPTPGPSCELRPQAERPDTRKYYVGEVVITGTAEALAAAWELSRQTKKPVQMLRIQLEPVGLVNANF